jgi:hypothetical protein
MSDYPDRILKPKYSEKTRPSATFSTTNPTWPDPGSNPGRRGGKPATNRLSYDTALWAGIEYGKINFSGKYLCVRGHYRIMWKYYNFKAFFVACTISVFSCGDMPRWRRIRRNSFSGHPIQSEFLAITTLSRNCCGFSRVQSLREGL